MNSVIESLLFVVGDEGISYNELKKILDVTDEKLNQYLNQLNNDYSNANRGIELKYLGNNIKLVTKKQNKDYLQKLVDVKDNDNLTPSAIETLAIIAYNQPITRISVDEIRGVSSAYLIRKLVYKNLICEMGRSEIAGRPILYGTTPLFLDYFGLKSINDLPNIEIESNDSIKELYESKYNEANI